MTQIDDILELVRTGAIIPETNVAILAREVERLRAAAAREIVPLTNSDEVKLCKVWFAQPEQSDYKQTPTMMIAFWGGMKEGYNLAISRRPA